MGPYKPLRTWVDDHQLSYGNNGSLDPSTLFEPGKKTRIPSLKLTATLPLKTGHPRKRSYSNHPFLGAMLVSGRVLSIESWLFNDGILIVFYYNPYGDRKSPGLWDPLQMACSWLINGGY